MTAKRRPSIHRLPAAVYRLFNEHGVLLYIGASYDPDMRIKRHRAKAWGPEIATTKTVWYTARDAAFNVEADAIRDEGPLYNIDSPSSRPYSAAGAPIEMDDEEIDAAMVRAVDEFMIRGHDRPSAPAEA